jgi:hypothetical protein
LLRIDLGLLVGGFLSADQYLAPSFPLSVVLSSGNADGAALDQSRTENTPWAGPGTPLIPNSHDAATLQVFATPCGDSNLTFAYAFASSEYAQTRR